MKCPHCDQEIPLVTANLQSVNMFQADHSGANLESASFYKEHLSGTDMRKARIGETDLAGAT
ncbi:MAG: hypothetical protein CL611_00390 [Anaerolineaceae bacterium]|jgi:uncharacterized protein YjbI with pentapeptide repeats|nr:hypothetical protein [Anaerolineaceae bacterium]